jgi:hypothetical protein
MEIHGATLQNPSEHLVSLRLSELSVKKAEDHVDFLCWLWGTYSCVPQSYGLKSLVIETSSDQDNNTYVIP